MRRRQVAPLQLAADFAAGAGKRKSIYYISFYPAYIFFGEVSPIIDNPTITARFQDLILLTNISTLL